MDIKNSVMQAIGIVKLDESAITKVSKDKEALTAGIIIIAIGAFLTALADYIMTTVFPSSTNIMGMEIGAEPISITSLITAPVGSIIGTFIIVGILFVIAKLFKGKSAYMELFRPIAFASILSWLGLLAVIPYLGNLIGILAGIWSIVVIIMIVRKVYSFSTGKAAGVVFILLAIFIAIAMVFAMMAALYLGVSALG